MINWEIRHEVKNFFENIKNKRVLDVGCGDGRYKKYIIDNNEYIGIDVDESGHPNQDKKNDITWNKKKLPFENEFFDIILMTEVLEHIENVGETLDELNRVLKNNGKIFITSPFLWKEHEKPYDFQRFTSFGIKKIIEQKGFKILTQKKLVQNKLAIIELVESELNDKIKLNQKAKPFLFFSKIYYFIIKNIIKIIIKLLINDQLFRDYYIGNCVIAEKIIDK